MGGVDGVAAGAAAGVAVLIHTASGIRQILRARGCRQGKFGGREFFERHLDTEARR
jgi:hypothetical protein